jgi:hypothetical protein
MSTDDRNGAPARQLTRATWRKSSHSGKEGNCVELARMGDGGTALRDSHDPHGPTLRYSANHMAAFLVAAKDGDFDVRP